MFSWSVSQMFLNWITKTTDQRDLLCSGVFNVYFEQVFQIVLVSSWLILDKLLFLFDISRKQIVEKSMYLHFEISYGSQWDHFENAIISAKV